MRPVVLQMGMSLDVGNGTGLFGPLREPRRVDLVEARSFPSGTVINVYRPHEGTR